MARHEQGFSLIEVIVALSLTSLLLTGLYSAFAAVGRTHTTAANVHRRTQEQRLITAALRSLIGSAVPLTEKRGEVAQVLFEGDRSRLRFVTHLPAHAGGGGLQFVDIRAEDELRGERRRSLVLTYRAAWPSTPFDAPSTESGWSSETLVEGLERVEIEYFGADDDSSRQSWRASWQNAGRLPTLVRVAVAAGEPWPELVVPVRAEVSEAMPYWHRDTGRLR